MEVSTSSSTSPNVSPNKRRNKRKPLEPKKLLHSPEQQKVKRQRLGSTGSEDMVNGHLSPDSNRSCSAGSSSSGHIPNSRSPSPNDIISTKNPNECLAPKLRFKNHQQAKKQQERLKPSKSKSNSESPFRPWDDLSTTPQEDNKPQIDFEHLKLLALNSKNLGLTLQSMYPDFLYRIAPAALQTQASLAPSVSPPIQDEPLSLVKHNRDNLARDEEEEIDILNIKTEPKSGIANLSQHIQSKCPSNKSLNSESKVGKQRNYKNMTRERRVEANARERQRVHTITAAFDTLQAAIPTENGGQKLSKLSIIKIATSYIMLLSRMAGYDYSLDQSAPSIEECREKCYKLIESETKVRRVNNGNPMSTRTA